MAQNFVIKVGNLEIKPNLNNSKTAKAIYDKLLIKVRGNSPLSFVSLRFTKRNKGGH